MKNLNSISTRGLSYSVSIFVLAAGILAHAGANAGTAGPSEPNEVNEGRISSVSKVESPSAFEGAGSIEDSGAVSGEKASVEEQYEQRFTELDQQLRAMVLIEPSDEAAGKGKEPAKDPEPGETGTAILPVKALDLPFGFLGDLPFGFLWQENLQRGKKDLDKVHEVTEARQYIVNYPDLQWGERLGPLDWERQHYFHYTARIDDSLLCDTLMDAENSRIPKHYK